MVIVNGCDIGVGDFCAGSEAFVVMIKGLVGVGVKDFSILTVAVKEIVAGTAVIIPAVCVCVSISPDVFIIGEQAPRDKTITLNRKTRINLIFASQMGSKLVSCSKNGRLNAPQPVPFRFFPKLSTWNSHLLVKNVSASRSIRPHAWDDG
jgi:hypothetical protein